MVNRRNNKITTSVKRRNRTETSAAVALRTVTAAKVVELAASGVPLAKVAEALDITRDMASRLYHAELTAIMAENNANRELLLGQELETLRLLKRAWMPKALAGDAVAARIVLGVVDRTSSLLGLDAAIKIEISNKRIDTTINEVLELLENSSDMPIVLDAEETG